MYKYLISAVIGFLNGHIRVYRTIIEIDKQIKTEQDIYDTEKLLELDDDVQYISILSFNLLEE